MAEPKLFSGNKEKKGKKKHKKHPELNRIEEFSNKINNTASRLRVLEERYLNLRKKTQLTDQNMIDFEQDIRKELKMLKEKILKSKKRLAEIEKKVDEMGSGVGVNTVDKHEFRTFKRYVEMWEPMNFITREEAKKLIESKERINRENREREESRTQKKEKKE